MLHRQMIWEPVPVYAKSPKENFIITVLVRTSTVDLSVGASLIIKHVMQI